MKRFLFAGEGCVFFRRHKNHKMSHHDNFMGLKFIFLFLFFFSSIYSVSAYSFVINQSNSTVSITQKSITYQIGDKLPKDFVIGYDPFDSEKIYTLADFKGKAVILDAWATWCGSCISKFPLMDSLQRIHHDKLNIILVNVQGIDTPEKVRGFLKNYYLNNPQIQLNVLIESPPLQKFFSFRSIPHYIWIDPNRRIRAFSDASDLQEENLKRLFVGLPIYISMKLN